MAVLVGTILLGCNKRKATTSSATDWLTSFSSKDGALSLSPSPEVVFGATSASGTIYLSGTSSNSFVIRKSSDGGETWSTIHNYGATSFGYGITIDSLGNIFAVGTASSGGSYIGLVRKSTDGGATWNSVYAAQVTPTKDTVLTAITHDSSDNLYAVGYSGATSPIDSKWVTLKSSNQGSSWSVVDTFTPDGLRYNNPTGVLVSSSGKIYVWGNSVLDGDGAQVRMSSDNGATWSLVYESWGRNIGSIVEWSDGLVMSESYTASGEPTTWRVLGTSDDFAHLKIIEGYLPEGSPGAWATAMKVDSRGYLFVNGYYLDASYYSRSVLLVTRGDGNWDVVDDFSPGDTLSTFPSDIFFDGGDGVFYAVGAQSGDGNFYWTIRAAEVTSAATFTPDPIPDGSDLISPIPEGAKRMFVTNATHSGVFGVSQTSAIAAADALCASDSNKPLGGGTYKALFVNSQRRACTTPNCGGGVSEHLNWVLASDTQYVRRDGSPIGGSSSLGLFDSLDGAISPYNSTTPWTGLSVYLDWTIQSDDPGGGNGYCNGWISSGGAGTVWNPTQSDFSAVYTVSGLSCSAPSTLLCVEQ